MVRAITRGRGQLPHRSPSQKTAGADICAGKLAIVAAQESPGDAIRLAGIGLEDGRQVGNCDSGYSCAYSNNLPGEPLRRRCRLRSILD